jgi:PAS domain S-box-containing protein
MRTLVSHDDKSMDAIADAASLCRSIVETTSDAIIFADREGRIRLWNRGATLVFGYDVAEVIGQSLDLIIPERLRRAHWDAYDAALASGRTKHTDRVLTTRSMHKDGRTIYVDLSFGLVKDGNGDVHGAFATGRDCTERYLAERAAKQRLQALEAAATPSRLPEA